jgi:alkaline phosphatase D
MKRRSVVAGLGTLWLPSLARASAPLAADPFGLGVASGQPRPHSVVLWTRLVAADRAERPAGAIQVGWAVAEDDGMRRIVRSGVALAEERWAHSVHVDVEGLRPNRPYWYRFTVGGKASPVGRTLTAPAPTEKMRSLGLAFASCQQYEQGYYSAWRHAASEELNAVLFLGDYMYEVSWGRDLVRHHTGGRTTLLDEYRDRYALYKSDRDLQAAHAAHPWIVMWDDHEVANDYANDISPVDLDPAAFLAMRARAYQAYWEHMPLSDAMRPQGPSLRLHERYRFGELAELTTLDDRQYRSRNACEARSLQSRFLVQCAERTDPARTMLGAEQEAWFAAGMKRASARWNLVGQQTLMAEAVRHREGREIFWADGWDGYPAARQRLLEAVAASPVRDTLVLGGDVHSFWAADLRSDFRRPDAAVVATEFVGGSITSQGPKQAYVQGALDANPHLRYGRTGVNGYGLLRLEPGAATVAFRTVGTVKKKDSPISTLARFAVEAGKPGAVQD